MFNLNGYHFQGTSGTGGGEAPAGSVLLPAYTYNQPATVGPLQTSFPEFREGKECYILYTTKDFYGEPLSQPDCRGNYGLGDSYFGPYYFGYGITEVGPASDYESSISSYIDRDGNIIQYTPGSASFARCYMPYVIVGSPAPGARWYTTLPDNGFCANPAATLTISDMVVEAASMMDSNIHGSGNGGQYKFNGRYVATGSGGSSDAHTGLKAFEGYKPWATGAFYFDDSIYYYLSPRPSFAAEPFGNYNLNGMTAYLDFSFYSGNQVPSISTFYQGYKTTLSGLNSVLGTGGRRLVSQAFNGLEMFTAFTILFPGYSYPIFGPSGMWLPCYTYGVLFASEAITL